MSRRPAEAESAAAPVIQRPRVHAADGGEAASVPNWEAHGKNEQDEFEHRNSQFIQSEIDKVIAQMTSECEAKIQTEKEKFRAMSLSYEEKLEQEQETSAALLLQTAVLMTSECQAKIQAEKDQFKVVCELYEERIEEQAVIQKARELLVQVLTEKLEVVETELNLRMNE